MKEKSTCIIRVSIVIVILWILFGGVSSFFKESLNWISLLSAHIVFLTVFIVLSVSAFKRYKRESEMLEKAEDFKRKIEWEALLYKHNEQNRQNRIELNNIDNKVAAIVESILDKKKRVYDENLDALKKNVELYNKVKEILEDKK